MGLDKIAEYKKILGITTEELSARSGIPVGTLNKILSGATRDPKLETLKAISRVLGLSLNDFDDRPGSRITLSPDEAGLLDDYQKLNDAGRQEVRKYTRILSGNDEYTQRGNGSTQENVSA